MATPRHCYSLLHCRNYLPISSPKLLPFPWEFHGIPIPMRISTAKWLIHSIASPYYVSISYKCLRRRSRNQILRNPRQNWVSVWLFFLMPEFDGTTTKRKCVDVSDVLINVASDRSDHQCCGSCMALAWLLLLCQLGCQKWKIFQSGKITTVLVIRIILVLVSVSFCWII